MSNKTGQAPVGCCGQYVPQAFQEKNIFRRYIPLSQVYHSFPWNNNSLFNCALNVKYSEKIRTVVFPFTCMLSEICSFNMLYVYSVIRIKHNHVPQLKNHSLKQKYSRSQKIKIKISINILNGVTYQNNRMKVRAGCDVTGVISQQHVELCRYGRNTWVPEIIFWFTKRFTATCLQCSTLIPLHSHDVL